MAKQIGGHVVMGPSHGERMGCIVGAIVGAAEGLMMIMAGRTAEAFAVTFVNW
jgi:hypothetical protein